MGNRPTYKIDTALNAANTPRKLEAPVVLSNARATFDDNRDISDKLVEIANKLNFTSEWIQWYAVEKIQDMLTKTWVVIDTSMSIAIAGILTDRSSAANDEGYSKAA